VSDSSAIPSELQQQQQEDEDCRQLISLKLAYQTRPPADMVTHCTPAVKTYLTMWENIELKQGILYRKKPSDNDDESKSVWQYLLPYKQRAGFLRQVHAGFGGGHFGIRRTMDAVKQRAYWVGWGADTRQFCQSCAECASYHRGSAPRQGPLQQMTTGCPWERLGVDVTGPHPKSSRGHVYILTVIDYFSKWADAYQMRNQEATTVAKILVERLFAYFGTPIQILMDRGGNFQSHLFKELLSRLNIDQARTTPFRASTNGLCERLHRSLNAILAKVVNRSQRDWIPYAMAAYAVPPTK
jgi:hypothetical protein